MEVSFEYSGLLSDHIAGRNVSETLKDSCRSDPREGERVESTQEPDAGYNHCVSVPMELRQLVSERPANEG